jgi:dolichyl-diphosphooligosaccharide--protein glycosyltransferase/undecaprenyl-diphosphooligosaccharide--protein glycosyltransferase
MEYLAHIILLLVAYFVLLKGKFEERKLIILAAILFVMFLFFGDVVSLIWTKASNYLIKGTRESGLHFYAVNQTVREAGQIPFSTMANRISGSSVGVLVALIGYIVLIVRHRAFILALPLIGIGVFSLWGGLRFTVYAVPVAAMSAVYLFFVLGDYFKNNKLKYAFVALATTAMLYPNIMHIVGYKVPTVLNKAEVEDLVKLDKIASGKDYTLSWWDYGYPIWYYSDTSTLIDGGKHDNDNFIISKIMQSSSPDFVANLSRLAVETYVDSRYSVVSNVLFRNRKKDLENKVKQPDPNILLSELEDPDYKLPSKTRDIYLYLPYRMLRIFPTVMVFGNLDLTTGKKLRNIVFYPASAVNQNKAMITLSNGIRFDTKKGKLFFGKEQKDVKNFIIAQSDKRGKISLRSQLYRPDGDFAVVYMRSYGLFVVMDIETFKSTYVQMFMLGKYDKNLFELVVASPYSRIYKLKK